MSAPVCLTPDELAAGRVLAAYAKAQEALDAAVRHLERAEIERPDDIGKAEWRVHRALRRRNRAYEAYREAWDAAQTEGGER